MCDLLTLLLDRFRQLSESPPSDFKEEIAYFSARVVQRVLMLQSNLAVPRDISKMFFYSSFVRNEYNDGGICNLIMLGCFRSGDRGSTVVKVLCYKS